MPPDGLSWADVMRYLDERFDRLEQRIGGRLDRAEKRLGSLEETRAEARGASAGATGFWQKVREWGAVLVTTSLAAYTILRGR